MPNYIRLPYAENGNSRLADLVRQQGQDAANAQREQANISAQMWGNLGNTINSSINQYVQARQQEPINKLNQLRVDAATQDAEGQKAAIGMLAGPSQLGPNDVGPREPSPFLKEGGVIDVSGIRAYLAQQGKVLPDKLASSWNDQNSLHARGVADAASRAVLVRDTIAHSAGVVINTVRQLGMDPVKAVDVIAEQLGQNPLISKDQLQKIVARMKSDPENIMGNLTLLRDSGSKGAPAPIIVKPGDVGLDPSNPSGKPLFNIPTTPTTKPDYTLNDQRFSGATNQSLTPPPVKPPKMYPVTVPGPGGRPVEKLVTEAELMQGVPAYRAPASPREPKTPNYMWAMKPDGTVGLMDPEEVRASGAQQPPTADMRNKDVGRALVSRSINAIEDLSRKIITKVGPSQRADAIARGADAVFGNDPEFRTYQDARTALAGNLAVAQQGSRPSDADIKAIWLPLVPDAYRDTADSANMKWDLIKTLSHAPPSEGGADQYRSDGSKKGSGFLGALPRTDGSGKVSSELSIGVNIDGKEIEIPTMVPTLSPSEKDWLLSHDIENNPKAIPPAIIDKAIAFAKKRIAAGQPVFATTAETAQPRTLPPGATVRRH